MIPAESGGGDRFADWDAAYVLGALGPSDRRAYERHLAECDACRAAVADLAGLPGLLGTISPAHAQALVEEAPGLTGLPDGGARPGFGARSDGGARPEGDTSGGGPSGGPLPDGGAATGRPAPGSAHVVPLTSLARAARRSRFRRRTLGAVAASALLVAGAVGGSVLTGNGVFGTPGSSQGGTVADGGVTPSSSATTPGTGTSTGTDAATDARTIELRPVDGADMRAEVVATPTAWGTKFKWSCHYPPDPGDQPPEGAYVPREPIRYELVLVDRDGTRTVAATWSWAGGETTGLDASTAVSLTDMDRIEITLDGHEEALATATL
ncbi:anti-sigma factor family protein [Promicromonospora sukumoe]|uniref:anti-sigma factor family protein n=1 Tax=Promicromonospora sukumoe TaxID=88382 RepID=UPI0037CB83D2